MKKLEKLIPFLILLGVLMKALFLPYGNRTMAFPGILLIVIYLPLGFFLFNEIRLRRLFSKRSYAEITKKRTLLSILAGAAFAACVIGILLKLLIVPYPTEFLAGGLAAGLVVTGLSVLGYRNNEDRPFYRRILKRSAIILTVSAILLAIPSLTLVSFFYSYNPAYIKAYKKMEENPGDPILKWKVEMALLGDSIVYEEFRKRGWDTSVLEEE